MTMAMNLIVSLVRMERLRSCLATVVQLAVEGGCIRSTKFPCTFVLVKFCLPYFTHRRNINIVLAITS